MRTKLKICIFAFILLISLFISIGLILRQNSLIFSILGSLYLAFAVTLIIIFINKNYNSIKVKMGLFPVYPPPYCANNHDIIGRRLNPLPFHNNIVAFVGDSVTFGYDDDNFGKQLKLSWPEEVSELLGCTVINCGVSSGTLLPIDSWSPISWTNEIEKIPAQADIVGVMIGINDCFRKYPIGKFDDNDSTSFYGGLHLFIKGLQQRFPASKAKKIILVIYPHYDADENFKKYVEAMYSVAGHYSVPICDLSINLGASPYNDPDYFYWRKYPHNDFHSPHPTQPTSHLIALTVANYLNSHYGIH